MILQHPGETSKPLNTARIVELSLQRVQLFRGIEHDIAHIQAWCLEQKVTQLYLLYLSKDAKPIAQSYSESEREGCGEESEANPGCTKSKPGFLILDGTWRNVRQLYLCNEWMHDLPKVQLTPLYKSSYRIRKVPSETALSTVESVVELLRVVDPDVDTQPLLDCFTYMINQQIEKMGSATYEKNYK